MKKELRILKLNRFMLGMLASFVQFWYVYTMLGAMVAESIIGGGSIHWVVIILDFIVTYLLHKVLEKPMEKIEKAWFGAKMEDINMQISKILQNMTDRRIAKANEREDIFNTKVEIITELKTLQWTRPNITMLREVADKLNNVHAAEVNNKNVIDIRDIEMKKREYKQMRKETVKLVNKVKVSKLNIVKLKEIEEIITGAQKKKEQEQELEHKKQLELAQAGAQQIVVATPMIQQPMLQQGNQQFLAQPQQNTIQYIEQQENGETNDIQNNQSTNNWNNTQQ